MLIVMIKRLHCTVVYLYSFSQQHDTSNQQPGMILSTHVSSSKTGGGTKSLEGLNLSLSERYVDLIDSFAEEIR